MEEITVEIKSLLHHICKKWRVLLVWMILGAVLADAAAIAKNCRQVEAVKAQQMEDSEESSLEDTEELKAVLTKKEAQEVQNAASSYLAYVRSYNNQLAYYCDSILMQLDANKVPTLTLQYYIDNGYKAEYPVVQAVDNAMDIGDALGNYAMSDSVCEAVVKELDWDKDAVYVKELIGYACDNHSLTITVIAPETEDCKKIGEIIKKEIETAKQKLQEIYGTFDVRIAIEECMITASQALMTQQTTQLASMYSSKGDFRTSISGFTEDQKKYYNALINNSFEEEEVLSENAEFKTDEEMTAEDSEADETVLSVQYVHVKFILLGILAGAFFCICWLCVTYINSGLLRTAKDIKEGFGISVIGTLKPEKEQIKNPIDRLVWRIFCGKGPQFSREEQLHMSAAAIRIGAQKAGMHRLYLCSSANDENTRQNMDKLAAMLEKQKVEVQTGASVVYDPESLECMSGCDGLVLMESEGYSLYKDILAEKQLAEGSHVPILGSVVIRE